MSDCERVQSSEYAQLAGVPVALIGLLGHSAILASLIEAICQWCIASALTIAAIAGIATVRALSSPGAIVAGRDLGGVQECRRWASRSTSSQR